MKKFFSLSKIAVGIFIFLSFWGVTAAIADPDLWWHLRVGEWVVEHQDVPHYDIYSHTMPGVEWFDHEWLVEALMWLLYAHGLWWLVIFVFSLLAFLPFLIWLRRAQSFIHVWLIILIALAMTHTMGVRAQVVSFALFFVVFEILRKRYEEAPQSAVARISFFALPVLFFAWANIHAGFFSGLMLFGIFIFVKHAIALWKEKKILCRALALDASVLFASFAATFINPYSWKVYQLIFEAILSPETAKYIIEWQPVFNTVRIHFIVIVGLFIFFAVRYWRKYPPILFVVTTAFFLMFIKSVKMGPLFFMTVIPFFAYAEGFLKEEIALARKEYPFTPKMKETMKTLAVFLFFIIFFLFGYHLRFFTNVLTVNSFASLPHSPDLPEKALSVLREEAARGDIGNVFNAYDWGGYIIFYAPSIKVFIDGRMPHWVDASGSSITKEYIDIQYENDGDRRRELLQNRKIETMFIQNFAQTKKISLSGYFSNTMPKPERKSLQKTLTEEGWTVIYEDEVASILRCPAGVCWTDSINKAL